MSAVSYIGADPDQLDLLGHSLHDGAGRFDELRSTLSMALYAGVWNGPDADSARSDWELLHSPALMAVADVLVLIADHARSHASAQREASAGDMVAYYQNAGWPPPDYPGDGDPEALRAYWLGIAAANAGIDMSLWDPALGASQQRPIIEAVYTYYANLYLNNPDFLWAGMAAMVGPSFAAGFYDLGGFQFLAQAIGTTYGDLPLIGDSVESVAILGHNDLIFYETTFLQMQQDIFVDQAVMHEAYLSGGMPAVQDLLDAGIIDQATYDAWSQIDSGDPALVEQGNAYLLYREQHDIIQPSYDAMYNHDPSGEAFTYFLGVVGDPAVPGGQSYGDFVPLQVTSELITDIDIPFIEPPTPDIFFETPFPDGNLANFDDRWTYITEDTLPAFQLLARENPALVTEILSTPVDQRIDAYRIDVRYDAIMYDIQHDWRAGVFVEHEQQ